MTLSQGLTIIAVLACVLVPYALEAYFSTSSTAESLQEGQ